MCFLRLAPSLLILSRLPNTLVSRPYPTFKHRPEFRCTYEQDTILLHCTITIAKDERWHQALLLLHCQDSALLNILLEGGGRWYQACCTYYYSREGRWYQARAPVVVIIKSCTNCHLCYHHHYQWLVLIEEVHSEIQSHPIHSLLSFVHASLMTF